MTDRRSALERLRDRLADRGVDPAQADRAFWDDLDPEERAAILTDFRIRANDRRYLEGVAPFIPARFTRRPVRRPKVTRVPADQDFERGNEALRSIEAAVYLEALVPESAPSRGRCRCPWPNHEDLHPSASYNGTAFFCHTCGEGGGIFQLGAALTGLRLHGTDFLEVRKYLAERLIGAVR